MNTLIVSTFSCTFEDYEKTVADFHEKVGHKYVKDYEISKESDHKGHLVLDVINPHSLTILDEVMVEPALRDANPEAVFQFEREGYFVADRFDHVSEKPGFNLVIGLRDTWSDKNV